MEIKKLLPNPFISALTIAVILAFLFPFSESFLSAFPLKKAIKWGIAGIFFMYGLKLNFSEVTRDMANTRLHLLIQFSTFVLFPLSTLLVYPFLADTPYFNLWLAVFFLAALPSTVSSSVVMVAVAGGNIPAAIFNASISGLIGLLLTPLWMSLFIEHTSGSGHFSEMIIQLSLQVVIPVLAGLILNPLLGKMARSHSAKIGNIDKLVILIIVYESFSGAFTQKLFSEIRIEMLTLTLAASIAMFFGVFYFIKTVAGKWCFSKEDTITAIFCGSKKSLVHGSVFISLIIADTAQQSLFLLPVMIYHSFQLFYASYMAEKWRNEV
jgi:solute carrier family 10 (sodium/bile acid cotransporter), member 7